MFYRITKLILVVLALSLYGCGESSGGSGGAGGAGAEGGAGGAGAEGGAGGAGGAGAEGGSGGAGGAGAEGGSGGAGGAGAEGGAGGAGGAGGQAAFDPCVDVVEDADLRLTNDFGVLFTEGGLLGIEWGPQGAAMAHLNVTVRGTGRRDVAINVVVVPADDPDGDALIESGLIPSLSEDFLQCVDEDEGAEYQGLFLSMSPELGRDFASGSLDGTDVLIRVTVTYPFDGAERSFQREVRAQVEER